MNVSDEPATTPDLFQFNTTSNNIWEVPGKGAFNVIYIINAVLGIPTKCYVLWLIFMDKRSGVILEFFNVNLTVCDLLFCLGGLAYIFVSKYPQISAITVYLSASHHTGRPLFLCIICLEQYLAVVHPITFLKYKTLRNRFKCSAAVWVMILVSGVFYVYVFCSQNVYLFICGILPPYFIILSIKCFCCLAIFRALRHPGPGQKGKDREKANHVKRKAIKVILITIVTVVTQYIPLFIAGFLYGVLPLNIFYINWTVAFTISMLTGYVYSLLFIHRVRNK